MSVVVPAVSVTVVLHNSEDGLAACLRGLAPELADGFAELIAVDNASPDDSAAIVRRDVPGARVVAAARNGGFAAGANLAWPHVQGRYWMLLNPDVTLEAGALRALAAWMDARPAIGVASADLRDGDGDGPPRTGRALPSVWRPLLEASRLHLLLPRGLRGRLLRGSYWRGGDQLDAGWVPGTAMIVRRVAASSVGPLDERFFLYGEDLEWCWRMRRAGWGIGVCDDVIARHRESRSAARTFAADDLRARMIGGELAAVRLAQGRAHARAYALATAVALRLEGHRSAARAWRVAGREVER